MALMKYQLSKTEMMRLAELETVIASGLKTFIEVGRALQEIKDKRYYKAHKTWDAYCRERWGFQRRHANRLIDAATVVAEMGPAGPIPTTERQARELARMPKKHRKKVWEEVTEGKTAEEVSAPEIRAKAQEIVVGLEDTEEKSSSGNNESSPSTAFYYAQLAIAELKRISAHDPNRDEALKKVSDWINARRKQ